LFWLGRQAYRFRPQRGRPFWILPSRFMRYSLETIDHSPRPTPINKKEKPLSIRQDRDCVFYRFLFDAEWWCCIRCSPLPKTSTMDLIGPLHSTCRYHMAMDVVLPAFLPRCSTVWCQYYYLQFCVDGIASPSSATTDPCGWVIWIADQVKQVENGSSLFLTLFFSLFPSVTLSLPLPFFLHIFC
jgi:hypothetical protein